MEFNYAEKLNDSLVSYLFITGAVSMNVQDLLGPYSIPIPIGINSCEQEKSSKSTESF
ncbi:hypothetical protein A8938_2315 [Algoriphagus zhangzhouensis]|uniref:Uncharacterized protein n=1 Tax=Algoriphagus zhangzhouensis TaxID=1073327 RepID=A0A1M7ZDN3_9BACT|nr:hypothetical protein A8938_2315 [Algoriphagus zhangzhouensis]SHO62786.1 hypothetical protein SAMN04488108_2313 [Algoriphagus zhangzhouensis]